jgi:hypothetical protein
MGLALQPHVVVVCEDLDKLGATSGSSAYAVVQSNMYYEMASIVAAVDVCLKAALFSIYVIQLQPSPCGLFVR